MIVAFPSRATHASPGDLPERRRVVIIGAGAAGFTAALHIGEHSVLLEQRFQVGAISDCEAGCDAQGGSDDRKSSFPLGATRIGQGADAAGTQDGGTEGRRSGVSARERQEVARACTPDHRQASRQAGEDTAPVDATRWIPPRLDPDAESIDVQSSESLQGLVPLLRGELRLGVQVTRIVPAAHLVVLADGRTILYDKLVSSIESIELVGLLQPLLPSRIRTHQGLMYWLAARDIELLDDSTQFLYGDLSPFAGGRRVAQTVQRALAQKFRPASDPMPGAEQLFKPRLVPTSLTSAAAH
jgi:glycine/D-amino acid oxidase-like deaminating enzyme